MEFTEEMKAGILKIGAYLIGVLAGLGAKLATANRKEKLTIKQFVYHSVIAFACALLVWNILSYYGELDKANVVSVIVGRYGDLIIYAIWGKIKDFIASKKIEE
jgi:hypothetical protein